MADVSPGPGCTARGLLSPAVEIGFDARALPDALSPDLSTNAAKRWLFANDIFFREAWWAFSDSWGGAAAGTLGRLTSILFKPDGIVSRSIEPCIEAAADLGLLPVFDYGFRFDRLTIRELWRYDLNMASRARMPLIDELLTTTESRLVFFEDVHPGGDLPCASQRLTAAKGPSRPTAERPREAHHIRARIGSGTGVLNHIHSPDDTADLVREIGVMMDGPAIAKLIAAVRDGNRPTAAAIAHRAYSGSPARDLNAVTANFQDILSATPPPPAVAQALVIWNEGGCPSHEALASLHLHLGLTDQADPWDRVVLSALAVETDLEHGIPLINGIRLRPQRAAEPRP